MRNWERPMTVVDTFVANEFVSACGDNHKVYNFKCNAGEEGHKYNVYYYDNHNRKHYIASEIPFAAQFDSYHPCNATHEASTKDEFINGYIDDQSTWKDEKMPVVIWTDRGTNVHCTKILNTSEWTISKS